MEHEQVEDKALIRVLAVDDSRIHTQLLAEALRRDGGLEVFTSDSKSVIAAALAHKIDILIISSSLDEQEERGYEALRELHSLRPQLRAVVLLDSSQDEVMLEAFRAGARGVLSRLDPIENLCRCVHCVHQGQIWANTQQMALVLEALASSPTARAIDGKRMELLSKREMEIVHCLAEGLTNREIAKRLSLSPHTVKNYLFRIFDKLGASNRVELLFMTLSQTNASQTVMNSVLRNHSNGELQDVLALAERVQAAEHGQPIAQLALAQELWTRRASAKDIIQAYKWYLIASDQVLQASKTVGRAMTMQQLIQAEQLAAEWLKKDRKIPPTSTIGRDRSPMMELAKASTA
jgi:two-component system nitrate/nitrite response regulator NarL